MRLKSPEREWRCSTSSESELYIDVAFMYILLLTLLFFVLAVLLPRLMFS
jgi:hypothetical protein